jgi:hypothetical protein
MAAGGAAPATHRFRGPDSVNQQRSASFCRLRRTLRARNQQRSARIGNGRCPPVARLDRPLRGSVRLFRLDISRSCCTAPTPCAPISATTPTRSELSSLASRAAPACIFVDIYKRMLQCGDRRVQRLRRRCAAQKKRNLQAAAGSPRGIRNDLQAHAGFPTAAEWRPANAAGPHGAGAAANRTRMLLNSFRYHEIPKEYDSQGPAASCRGSRKSLQGKDLRPDRQHPDE